MSKAGDKAKKIAAEGKDVRQRVRALVSRVAADGKKTLREVGDEAGEILRGAGEGVRKTGQEHRGEVLGEVIDGVAEGLSTAAKATKMAIKEAESRGQRFAEEDLRRSLDDLRSLERTFVDTVQGLATSARDSVWEEAKGAASHARRAGEAMRPSIDEAIQAATEHPVKLAGEAASAGVAVTRQAVGSLFEVAGGLLAGAGDAVKPKGKGKKSKKGGKKSKKKGAGKSAKKVKKKGSKKKGKGGKKKSGAKKKTRKKAKKKAGKKKSGKKTGKKAGKKKSGGAKSRSKSKKKAGRKR